MKASKTIAIGVMPQAKLREHVLAIARGDYRPKASDPKIWFTSMKTAASVLSDENRALLRTIAATQPASIAALAAEAGESVRRVSRTLATLSRYGLVDLQLSGRSLRPVKTGKNQLTQIGENRARHLLLTVKWPNCWKLALVCSSFLVIFRRDATLAPSGNGATYDSQSNAIRGAS